MLTCFKCMEPINNPAELFRHIKEVHKICGNNCRVQCTLCWKAFTNFATFKSNVLQCFDAIESDEDEEVDPALYMYAVDAGICNFETTLRKAAVKLACGLSAKMNWPRQDVFTAMSEVKNTFISIVASGISIRFCVHTFACICKPV